MLTADILRKIAPAVKDNADSVALSINTICPAYGIETADIMHEFIANLAEECCEFTRFEENLYYTAERLMQVWPRRFPTMEDAESCARNPKKLANKVYGGRLGNIHPDDGFDFRGSGPMMLTGRQIITAFTIFYNKHFNTTYSVYAMAALLRTNIDVGIHSACWVFAVAKGLIQMAIDDHMKEIVMRINGGYIGLSARLRYYELAKKYII